MGRKRKTDAYLPRSMHRKHGAYYYVRSNKWTRLGSDFGPALLKYAEFVGKAVQVTTVGEAIASYLQDSAQRLAPATLEGYEYSAKRLTPVFGDVPLSALKPSDVYRYLKESGTVAANRDKALLSVAYTHARRIGAFSGDDPAKGLRYRNPEEPRDRYVTDEELAGVLKVASPKMRTLIRFAYLTGMRQGDILRLKCSDLGPEGISYKQGKTKHRILIEWTPELKSVVDDAKRLWRRFGRQYLFESIPRGKHAGRPPGPYTPSGLRALFRPIRAKAGLSDVRLHDFRRKAGSDLETEQQAQALLGHSSAKVTRKHYRAKGDRVQPVH